MARRARRAKRCVVVFLVVVVGVVRVRVVVEAAAVVRNRCSSKEPSRRTSHTDRRERRAKRCVVVFLVVGVGVVKVGIQVGLVEAIYMSEFCCYVLLNF